MSGSRDQILGAIRRSLKRAPGDEAAVESRLNEHPSGPVPARAQVPKRAQIELFTEQACAVQSTVEKLESLDQVPEAAARYLQQHNLPPQLRLAPDPEIETLPWQEKTPLLRLDSGAARDEDQVSLTGAFAGVAETGTLLLHSGPDNPTTLGFLPETHLVVLKTSRLEGTYEAAWARLRAALGDAALPRSVNFITGPSRTGDIEQQIQFGAHGPRRLHVLLVDDEAD